MDTNKHESPEQYVFNHALKRSEKIISEGNRRSRFMTLNTRNLGRYFLEDKKGGTRLVVPPLGGLVFFGFFLFGFGICLGFRV
jgi:hypothetical protein